VTTDEAERREAARIASRTGQEQPRETRDSPADPLPTATSRGSRPSSQSGGTPSREAQKARREVAELHAASLILADKRPTAKDFGDLYGQAETWGGDRFREASQRLRRDAEFRDRAEALRLDQMLTSPTIHHTA
ncbi:hypothetical protein, partial [Streptomyces sp. NPDC055140]